MKNKPEKLTIIYCGGCNPEIERGEIIQRFLEMVLGDNVSLVKDVEAADILLLVSGCKVSCAENSLDATFQGSILRVAGATVDYQPVRPKEIPGLLVEGLQRRRRGGS